MDTGVFAGPSLTGPPLDVRGPGSVSLTDAPDGVAVVAIPDVRFDTTNAETTEIAIANRVPVAGHTDLALGLFDANGLVLQRCWRLGALEVAYVDVATLGLSSGFRGSAVISATSWTHVVSSPVGPRNIVALGAVAISRHGVLGVDAEGDEVALIAGSPLLGRAGAMMAGVVCPSEPPTFATPSRTPGTPPPTPSPTTTVQRTPTFTPDPRSSATATGLPAEGTPTIEPAFGTAYLPRVVVP
jgi:hypothetical protein